MKTERELKQEICDVGRVLYERGLIVGKQGNLSIRAHPDEILITPRDCCKGNLKCLDLISINVVGSRRKFYGMGRASIEAQMHRMIYHKRPEITAIVHAHPVYATVMPHRFGSLETYPMVGPLTPGSRTLAREVGEKFKVGNMCLLRGHGAITCGEEWGLFDALYRMEELEHFAKMSFLCK